MKLGISPSRMRQLITYSTMSSAAPPDLPLTHNLSLGLMRLTKASISRFKKGTCS